MLKSAKATSVANRMMITVNRSAVMFFAVLIMRKYNKPQVTNKIFSIYFPLFLQGGFEKLWNTAPL